MTTCLPIEDTRRIPIARLIVAEEKEEEEYVLSKIIERGDSVSSLASPNVALGKMKIIDGEEEETEENEEFHDCREKFKKRNVVKTVIKKLSPSKNSRRSTRIGNKWKRVLVLVSFFMYLIVAFVKRFLSLRNLI